MKKIPLKHGLPSFVLLGDKLTFPSLPAPEPHRQYQACRQKQAGQMLGQSRSPKNRSRLIGRSFYGPGTRSTTAVRIRIIDQSVAVVVLQVTTDFSSSLWDWLLAIAIRVRIRGEDIGVGVIAVRLRVQTE